MLLARRHDPAPPQSFSPGQDRDGNGAATLCGLLTRAGVRSPISKITEVECSAATAVARACVPAMSPTRRPVWGRSRKPGAADRTLDSCRRAWKASVRVERAARCHSRFPDGRTPSVNSVCCVNDNGAFRSVVQRMERGNPSPLSTPNRPRAFATASTRVAHA